MNKLLSEENKVPRTLFEAWNVAGSATYKQSKTIWNCVLQTKEKLGNNPTPQ